MISTGSGFGFSARVLAMLALSALLGGCTDMITFSQRNREAGIDAYQQADYPKAAGAFRSALRQDPRDYRSHYYLGMSSIQLGNYQQAIVAFRSAMETQNVTLEGRHDNAMRLKIYTGMAQAIVKSDESDTEVNKVEQSARNSRGPSAAREFFILAKVYRDRKLPDMALDYYERATLNDPANFDFAKEYGLYCESLQQNAKARQSLRAAYALDGTDNEVATALGRLGVVVGPSLKNKDDLAKPLIPRGPLPEVDMAKVKASLGIGSEEPKPAPAAPERTANAPRD